MGTPLNKLNRLAPLSQPQQIILNICAFPFLAFLSRKRRKSTSSGNIKTVLLHLHCSNSLFLSYTMCSTSRQRAERIDLLSMLRLSFAAQKAILLKFLSQLLHKAGTCFAHYTAVLSEIFSFTGQNFLALCSPRIVLEYSARVSAVASAAPSLRVHDSRRRLNTNCCLAVAFN